MTARYKLADVQEHMRNRGWILGSIRHETMEGVHTYHECACGRHSARGIYCVLCLRELLDQVNERDREDMISVS